jgi:aminoglycoside phosphotransferase (APT) family kinase protein
MRAGAVSGLDFDPARLCSFLDAALPGPAGRVRLERIGGGQSNPTYFLTRGDWRLVLRKPPAAVLVKSAHDVAREYRILTALYGTAIPVPEPVLFVADVSVIGTPFYLMRRVDGVVHHDAGLASVEPSRRRALYFGHARMLAALHALDPAGIGLGDFARPGSFLDRQVRRWCDVWGDDRAGDLARVRSFLGANRPAGEAAALVHGDFKFNNVIVDEAGERIVGVLDWELAAVGDPLLDVAHMWAATWGTAPGEYGGIRGLNLVAAGLPAGEEYEAAYRAAGGAGGGLSPFYRALALLRYAGIFRGIGQRARAGTATSADAKAQGALAGVYLDRALGVIAGAS